ncbi:MAG: hypothetical protein ABIJ97_11090 [Bacteroidota bacterium]
MLLKNDFNDICEVINKIDTLLEKSLDIEIKETILSENGNNHLSEDEINIKIEDGKTK